MLFRGTVRIFYDNSWANQFGGSSVSRARSVMNFAQLRFRAAQGFGTIIEWNLRSISRIGITMKADEPNM